LQAPQKRPHRDRRRAWETSVLYHTLSGLVDCAMRRTQRNHHMPPRKRHASAVATPVTKRQQHELKSQTRALSVVECWLRRVALTKRAPVTISRMASAYAACSARWIPMTWASAPMVDNNLVITDGGHCATLAGFAREARAHYELWGMKMKPLPTLVRGVAALPIELVTLRFTFDTVRLRTFMFVGVVAGADAVREHPGGSLFHRNAPDAFRDDSNKLAVVRLTTNQEGQSDHDVVVDVGVDQGAGRAPLVHILRDGAPPRVRDLFPRHYREAAGPLASGQEWYAVVLLAHGARVHIDVW